MWLAHGGSAAEWTVQQWEQTVYYRFTFEAPAAAAGVLRIAAADEYELFLNGAAVGGDTVWTTAEEYPVSLQSRANHLGVRVRNRGQGAGSGLLVELVAAGQVWTSNTRGLNEVWLWSATPPSPDWLTADLSRDPAWRPAQLGNLDRSRIRPWADTLGAEIIAGFSDEVDTGQPEGGIALRAVRGENLALGKPANRPEVFDGRPATTWTINPDELNSVASADLLKRRLISGVRVLTAGKDATEFAENTMRGYAVQVSNDGFQWNEVGTIHGIEQFDQTAILFKPLFARHLRVVVAEVDPLRRSRVAEIQVFGEGVAPSGSYLSEPLDLGRPGERKNFGQIRWQAQLPRGTAISLQFRSADEPGAWSPWTPPIEAAPAELSVPEPRRLLQYRVDLSTEFEDATPRFERLAIDFTDQVPASRASGRVQPNRAVLGRDTLYTYTLELGFAGDDLGVERLRLATPSLAQVEEVVLPPGAGLAGTTVLGDALELTFAEPLRASGQISLRFRARLLTNQFAFASQLFGPGQTGALNAEEDTTIAPETGEPRSWKVRATDVSGPLLSQVRANPQIFTPNGDGLNEDTVVEFTLARVSAPQEMEIGVFDLNGRLVRRLGGFLSGGQYVRPPDSRDPAGAPGYWDGRDAAGVLVAPGIYLLRVRVDLGQGDETRVRTVAVVY